MAPDVVRRHIVIGRQIFGAFAGGDNAKTRGARPVHHLGDQRRLVAIGQRIDDAGAARFLGQQRASQHVGLHIDHDDMLAGLNGRARMLDAGGGIAGGLDDDIDLCRSVALAPSAVNVVAAIRAASQPTVRQASRARSGSRSAIMAPRARRVRHLRQEHRAELAGADQRHADRLTGRAAGVEQTMKVHGSRFRSE